jgi:hypothetical protein
MCDTNKLARFIKDSGLSYKQNSKSYIFTCPVCNIAEKLYIRKVDGKFACWRCQETIGFKGAPEYALSKLTNQAVSVVKRALYGLIDTSGALINAKFDDFLDESDREIVEEIYVFPKLEIPYHCLDITHPGAVKGANYLLRRGIHLEVASKYHIKYSPVKQAIMFPAYVGDDLLGWQYRTIEDLKILLDNDSVITRIKSLNSKDYPRDKILLFQNNIVEDYAVLCEGPIDAIKAGPGAVCSLGKAVSQHQVNVLLNSGIKRLYIAIDPDAFMELDPLIDKFDNSVELLKVDIPYKGKKPDMGELTFEEARIAILNAKPLRKNKIYIWMRDI